MDKVILAIVAVAVLGMIVKLSASARTERKLVMARLAEEDDLRGALPTEQLFRAASPPPTSTAPVAAAPRASALQASAPPLPPPAPSVPSPSSDLRPDGPNDIGAFFTGIQLPSNLVPWTGAPVSDIEASFTTMTPAPEVLTELAVELARLGMTVVWDAGSVESARSVEPGRSTHAGLTRSGAAGAVTVYASANQALDESGAPRFKGLLGGTTLVHLTV